MKSTHRHELPRTLAAHVDAAGAPPPLEAVERAQARLMARLRQAPVRIREPARMRWLAAAAMAALAVVTITMPLLIGQGGAFAAVQAHFRDFDTLSMRVEQRAGGQVVQTSHTVVNADGVLRTDIGGELSVIVDPVRGRLLTLLHPPRQATLAPLAQAEATPDAALEWLADIRSFRGDATPLSGTRTIDGRTAQGWALETEAGRLVLWADREGLPLAMETGGPGGLDIQYRFRFDAPVPPGHLSSEVPPGYRLVAPGRD
jgi:hypothetical protein